MSLASLTVDLTLGLAKFEGDAGKAATAAYKLGGRIGDGLKLGAQGALALGSAVAAASGAALAFADRVAKQTAELQDFATRSGASASAIASFTTAADSSGTSLDRITDLMVRLNGTLSKPIDPSRGAGAALKALNLDVDQLRALRPDERIEAIAQAFAGFEDGAGKSAAAVALLGKSGAESLPLLEALVEVGRSQISLTDEQIAQADRYSKAQAIARSELGQLASLAALQALPAMNALTEAMGDSARAILGTDEAANKLNQSSAIPNFAEGAVKALGFVVDAGDGVARVFELAGKSIGAAAAAAAAAGSGEFRQARSIMSAFADDVDALLNRELFSNRLAARLAASKLPAAAEVRKPALKFRSGDATKPAAAAKESTVAYDNLIRSIVEATSAAEAEAAGVEKLSAAQRFALEVVTKLAASEGKYTEAQKQSATTALEAFLAAAQTVEQREQQTKAAEAFARATADATAALDRETVARIDANAALSDALVEYGLTAEQVEALRIKRLEHLLVLDEEALAVGRARDLSNAEASAMERNINLLREQIAARRAYADKVSADVSDPLVGAQRGVKDYLDLVAEAGTSTRAAVGRSIGALEDDLVTSMATGKLSVRSFADTVVAEVNRLLIIRPLLQSLFNGFNAKAPATGGGGGLFSTIGSLIDGWFGTGGGGGIAGNDIALAYHSGGIAGSGGMPRAANAAMFAGAKRYHRGGMPGIGPDEVPAILRRGEEVLTRGDPRHRDNRSANRSPSLVIHNAFTIQGPTDRRSEQQIAAAALRGAQRALARY